MRDAGYASVRQCDLQDMILSVPRLKEYVGRNLLAKPNLLGKLMHDDLTCTQLSAWLLGLIVPSRHAFNVCPGFCVQCLEVRIHI